MSLLDCWEVAIRVTSVSATPSPVCTEKVGLGLSGEEKGSCKEASRWLTHGSKGRGTLEKMCFNSLMCLVTSNAFWKHQQETFTLLFNESHGNLWKVC